MALVYNNETLGIDDFDYHYSHTTVFDENVHEMFLFKNRNGFYDSYIFLLGKENKKSENCFGWIFPINIFRDTTSFLQYLGVDKIEDTLNTRVKNAKFFVEAFLYPAFCHLILDKKNLSRKNIDYNNVTDFYDEETYILMVNKERFDSLNLNIDAILPNLFKLGFSYIGKNEDFYTTEITENIGEKIFISSFSNLPIQVVSQDLKTETYIIELFKNLLKVELHPVMRFYLLYQVIELLINKVGLKKFSDKKADIMQMLSQPNPSHYHDISESMKELSKMSLSEEKRINFLFEENCNLSINNYNNLVAKSLFSTSYENMTALVYEHRNKLIHGYYNLQAGYTDIEEKLKNFNIEFEKLMVDVVTHYKDV